MKQKLTDWLTILVTAVVGVMFIVWHGDNSLFEWLVRGLGVVLLVPAIYETYIAVSGLQGKLPKSHGVAESDGAEEAAVKELSFGRRAAFVSMLIVSVVAIVAGMWMLIDPATFISLLAYIFAVILILFGIYQLFAMSYVNRSTNLPWYFFVVPAVFVVAGIVILFMSPEKIISTIAVITGVLLVLSAVNSAMQMIVVSGIESQRRRDARDAEKAEKEAGKKEPEEPKQIPESVD